MSQVKPANFFWLTLNAPWALYTHRYFLKQSLFFASWPFVPTKTTFQVIEIWAFGKLLPGWRYSKTPFLVFMCRQKKQGFLAGLRCFSAFWLANVVLWRRLYLHLLPWHAIEGLCLHSMQWMGISLKPEEENNVSLKIPGYAWTRSWRRYGICMCTCCIWLQVYLRTIGIV